jgi:hypothetical protein
MARKNQLGTRTEIKDVCVITSSVGDTILITIRGDLSKVKLQLLDAGIIGPHLMYSVQDDIVEAAWRQAQKEISDADDS